MNNHSSVRPLSGPLLGISPLKRNPYIGFFMHHQRIENLCSDTAIKKNPYIGLLRHDLPSNKKDVIKKVDEYYFVDVDDFYSSEESDNEGYDSCYQNFEELSNKVDFTMEVCVRAGKKLLKQF